VQAEVATDVGVAEPRPAQDRRRLQRPAGDHHGPCPDQDPVSRRGDSLDPAIGAIGDHPAYVDSGEDARARRLGVHQPGPGHRLLGPDPAAPAATTTFDVLVAADHVAVHLADLPAQSGHATLEDGIAARRA
jgi:hypothetical protein